MVNDFSYAFTDNTVFSANLGNWSTGNGTSFEKMMAFTEAWDGEGVRNWDVSKAETLRGVFHGSGFSPADINELADWDTSSCTDMDLMFYGTEFDGNITAWNTSKVSTTKRHDTLCLVRNLFDFSHAISVPFILSP